MLSCLLYYITTMLKFKSCLKRENEGCDDIILEWDHNNDNRLLLGEGDA